MIPLTAGSCVLPGADARPDRRRADALINVGQLADRSRPHHARLRLRLSRRDNQNPRSRSPTRRAAADQARRQGRRLSPSRRRGTQPQLLPAPVRDLAGLQRRRDDVPPTSADQLQPGEERGHRGPGDPEAQGRATGAHELHGIQVDAVTTSGSGIDRCRRLRAASGAPDRGRARPPARDGAGSRLRQDAPRTARAWASSVSRGSSFSSSTSHSTRSRVGNGADIGESVFARAHARRRPGFVSRSSTRACSSNPGDVHRRDWQRDHDHHLLPRALPRADGSALVRRRGSRLMALADRALRQLRGGDRQGASGRRRPTHCARRERPRAPACATGASCPRPAERGDVFIVVAGDTFRPTARSSTASARSTSRRSPASLRRSSGSPAATARPSPGVRQCSPTG